MRNDLEMFVGDSRTLRGEVVDQDRVAVNLGEATVAFLLTAGQAQVAKTTAVPAQCRVTNAAGGVFEVYLVPDDTKNLPAGAHHYRITVTTEAGKIYTVASARFTLRTP